MEHSEHVKMESAGFSRPSLGNYTTVTSLLHILVKTSPIQEEGNGLPLDGRSSKERVAIFNLP